MESTRPIRALTRGLDALTVLNLRDGATVSEVAQEIRLPRTTVYRILETLTNAGFVFRDEADDRYRLTVMVRGLSNGFDDETWITRVARPIILELGREIGWPVSISTFDGTAMMLRETSDHQTPLAIERYSAGIRLPLLGSAAGRMFLALCPAAQRDGLLDTLARSNKEEDKLARSPRADVERMLAEISTQGHATVTRTRRMVDEISVATPVLFEERVLAVLTVRFMAGAVAPKAGLERFLPKLQQCAAKISGEFSQHQAESRTNGAPETAV
jgi:IclR family mhp operon transcriptional activator